TEGDLLARVVGKGEVGELRNGRPLPLHQEDHQLEAVLLPRRRREMPGVVPPLRQVRVWRVVARKLNRPRRRRRHRRRRPEWLVRDRGARRDEEREKNPESSIQNPEWGPGGRAVASLRSLTRRRAHDNLMPATGTVSFWILDSGFWILRDHGPHQFQSPSRRIRAGTRRPRTIVASRKTAMAVPRPSALIRTMSAVTKERLTTTTIIAALVITWPLFARPTAMLASLSPVAS